MHGCPRRTCSAHAGLARVRRWTSAGLPVAGRSLWSEDPPSSSHAGRGCPYHGCPRRAAYRDLSHPRHAGHRSLARHGICANTTFDPEGPNYEGWYWYAADLQVPTLWDEARNAGLTTANMQWPVTAGAAIDFNVPQYWRAGTADDHKLLRLLSTPGLLELLERDTEPLTDGADESIDGDQRRAKAAVRLLELKRPGFMTVYLASLDNVEHEHGPSARKRMRRWSKSTS